MVPSLTPDNPSWSPHPPRTTQLGPLLTYLLYAMLLLVTSRNLNYLNRKLSRNFWLETFQKLLVGSFYYWLETSRNFWEVLETFQELLVGNFPGTFGWKLSRNFWLETFTIGWKLSRNFWLELFTFKTFQNF